MTEKFFDFIDDYIGLQVASIALLSLAVMPIVIGSYCSIKGNRKRKARSRRSRSRSMSRLRSSHHYYDSEEEENEDRDSEEERRISKVVTSKDAFLFPIIASSFVYFISWMIEVFNPIIVNNITMISTSILSCAVFTSTVISILKKLAPSSIAKHIGLYSFSFSNQNRRLCHINVTIVHVLIFMVSIGLSVTYALNQHWIIGNIFAISIAIQIIRTLTLNSFGTGYLLLLSMLAYDVFWVFGTDTMLHLSKVIVNSPTSVVWPRNINTYVFNKLLRKDQFFTMFGLGEIIIPGIFIAYCLKIDKLNESKRQNKSEQKKNKVYFKNPYFMSCLLAYTLGAGASIYTVHFTKEPQSAFLFVVPALILTSFSIALVRNELGQLTDCSAILETFSEMNGYTEEPRPTMEQRLRRAGRRRSSSSKEVVSHRTRSVSSRVKKMAPETTGVVEEAYEETKRVVGPYVEDAVEETKNLVTPYVEEAVNTTKRAVHAVATKIQEQTVTEEDDEAVKSETKPRHHARRSVSVGRRRRGLSRTNRHKS
ncbi:signal peptide peptidase-domain-containing protein [Cokeromyces recurvatus]|uniref:signal peptide peptidase-domain-containing protein n=1 Tax=Cokeromyces recurvatus TaxID=90255 RepID=UPI00222007A7|nr:signal peptide peptidase-domain-containing protein [Cokeromyces recurvatus]KAI7905654.1 signal peptide peptidase-domain-containing protein [Cokeromyces recurvatus]